MDADSLKKGDPFEKLPETYAIFITEGDALGLGAPLCSIDRVVSPIGVAFGDGSHIVYADATYNYGDTALGAVMHDFRCANPADMRCPALAERSRYLKEVEKGVEEMEGTVDDYLRKLAEKAIRQGLQQGIEQGIEQGMERGLEQGLEQGHKQGLERGLEQGRAEVVARIVADGSLSRERIAGVLGMTPEEVDACIESYAAQTA